jgi:hypothetical protein
MQPHCTLAIYFRVILPFKMLTKLDEIVPTPEEISRAPFDSVSSLQNLSFVYSSGYLRRHLLRSLMA